MSPTILSGSIIIYPKGSSFFSILYNFIILKRLSRCLNFLADLHMTINHSVVKLAKAILALSEILILRFNWRFLNRNVQFLFYKGINKYPDSNSATSSLVVTVDA
jgi:hypothetical protein